MTTTTAITLVVILLIIAVTVYELAKRKFEHKEIEWDQVFRIKEMEATTHMADKGYVQVPVLERSFHEADEHEAREDLSWMKVWVPPAHVDLVLAASGINNDNSILKAALEPVPQT